MQQAILAKMTPEQRVRRVLEWAGIALRIRFNRFREQHPGVSEAELDALWLEQELRGKVDEGLLAKAAALIRARDSAPADDTGTASC